MNRYIIFFCSFFVPGLLMSQAGVITYNKKYSWANIAKKMPYLSQEEKDRITLSWGNDDDNEGEDYILTYNTKGSVYKAKERDENFGYSWGEDEDVFIRDFETKTTNDQRELLGKLYALQGSFPKYKWKILNELKEVAGYVCMKAETKDTVNNILITAWFTDKLSVMSGPEGLGGLPGLILALDYNGDDIQIIATKVDLNPQNLVLPIPKKLKGKKSTYEDFNSKKKKHIEQSIAGRRNPYWDVRY